MRQAEREEAEPPEPSPPPDESPFSTPETETITKDDDGDERG